MEQRGPILFALVVAVRYVLSVCRIGIQRASGIIGKIFQPFFTTKESGTGLGLSMTRKILALHDGWITAASEPDKGSTFSVFLPKIKLS